MSLSKSQRQCIAALANQGWTYQQIANEFGIPRGSIGRIIHHERHGYGVNKAPPPVEIPRVGPRVLKDIKPAKHPFAPDSSCPDYAHDEAHCAAVLALGGYHPRRVA